jgi:hypothetical protein
MCKVKLPFKKAWLTAICWLIATEYKNGYLQAIVSSSFHLSNHKNWFKKDQERMHKLNRILDVNAIKICYENSANINCQT